MSPPKSVHTPADQPVVLELPTGDRYHLHPRPADLEGYLAPERVPHLQPGIAPIKVQVTHGAAGYVVTLAPAWTRSRMPPRPISQGGSRSAASVRE